MRIRPLRPIRGHRGLAVVLTWSAILGPALWSCESNETSSPADIVDSRQSPDQTSDSRAAADSDASLGTDAAQDADAQEDVPGTPAMLTGLHAEGTRLVNAKGEIVVLKGVNLGGWLFNETWITQIDYAFTSRLHVLGQQEGIGEVVDALLAKGEPASSGEGFLEAFMPLLAAEIGSEAAEAFVAKAQAYVPTVSDDSDLPLRKKLSERFGDDVRDELLDIFQGAWLVEEDIAWLAAQGFNLVRVPMTYRNLILGPDLDKPTELRWNEAAFARLEALLGWCQENGVYAVLDIQEAPGAQNGYAGEAQLYSDPKMQEMTVQLWTELSNRFHDQDAVAAYSLLAEPFGAPDAAARDAMYDKLVKAIRLLGDDHLLVIHDGFMGMDSLPKPETMGWNGVVYSTHFFEFNATSFEYWDLIVKYVYDPVLTEAQKSQNVPYFIGSFSTGTHADWAYDVNRMLVEWYGEKQWSWAVWTYKRIDDPIEKALWGNESSYGVMGRLAGQFDRPDVFDDSLETLRLKFAAYAELEIGPNQQLLDALTLKPAVRPLEGR